MLHHCKEQPRLYRSLIKYGVENHQFEIIEECEIEELNNKERYYQDLYHVLNNGLNCVLTETNILPRIYSREYRLKLSISAKKRGISKETKEKMIISRIKGNYKGINNPNSKKVICSKTGKIWNSINECSTELNILKSTLARYLSGVRKNKTTINYY